MPKQLIRPCPVCSTTTGDILHPTRFALIEGVPLVDHYDVVCCTRCGFCFADTASTQADYNAYYSMHSKYEDATTSTGSALSPADAARLKIQAEHIASLLPDRSIRIADIGCANGGLLISLKALGYTNLTGIDPSPACASTVASNERITGLVGTFSELPKVDHPFDLIILTGVMEHLRDVAEAVDAFQTILAPHGHIYLAMPDASRYHEKIYAPFQDFNTEHINHFSIPSLSNLMQRKGYRAIASGQQMSQETPTMAVPILFGLFTPTDAKAELVRDDQLGKNLKLYRDASQTIIDSVQMQMRDYFEVYPQLLVWGTGQLTLKLLTLPGVDATRIKAFVDGNPINQGRTLLGKPILTPKEITGMKEPILIMTTLHQIPIEQNIRTNLKMANPILTFSV